jgi:F420-0:gamma-glutamyl ligase
LDYVRATLKLRHLDEVSDDEVDEALKIGQTAIAAAEAAGILPAPAGIDIEAGEE